MFEYLCFPFLLCAFIVKGAAVPANHLSRDDDREPRAPNDERRSASHSPHGSVNESFQYFANVKENKGVEENKGAERVLLVQRLLLICLGYLFILLRSRYSEWYRELMVHLAPPAAQEESNPLTNKLVTAREDLEHNAKLYTDAINHYRVVKEEHAGCGQKVQILENEKNYLSAANHDQAARIQSLEVELAKKDSALTYTEKLLAKGAKDHERLTDQLSLSEPFNMEIQAKWGKGLSEGHTDKETMDALYKAENFDPYFDKNLYPMYDNMFEKEYPYIEKIASGYRHSMADLLNPESTTQTLPSFEEYTPPVTYPEDAEETLGTPMEVEPLEKIQLEDLGLNTCNHNIPLSSREVPSFDESKPQPKPLANFRTLDVSLGDERGPQPPIKPHSPDSFRMKVVKPLTIHTPPSPHVASFHPKDMYCYYRPCIDDPKKHYGFKPGLLGHSGSPCVDFVKLGMTEDDWELESKEISFLGRGLNSPVRPKEVEKIRIKETHKLYLMRRSLEVLRKFHWMILGGRFNYLSHVSSPLLSKPGEY
ncbi:hypothetical protein Tco_0805269 [Tanacetum coccineum]